MAFLAVGYDGLVRKWNSEKEVDKIKGIVLFSVTRVVSASSEVSVRKLSHYGITMDTDRTPTTENSAAVSVRGYSSPIVISFISKDDRDLFVSSISSEWSVCIKQMKNSMTG